jgi:tRNA-dihydrouridine synthase
MQIQIRKLKLKNNIFLAPMAGISDPVYCQIVKKYGCALAFSEMISIRAVNMGNVRTMEMLDYPQTTRPIAIQLFGNNPDEFVKAIQIIEKKIHPEMFDINMGCPVPKVAIKSKSGSALLKDPTKIAKIITAVRKCTKLPISIKIRSG